MQTENPTLLRALEIFGGRIVSDQPQPLRDCPLRPKSLDLSGKLRVEDGATTYDLATSSPVSCKQGQRVKEQQANEGVPAVPRDGGAPSEALGLSSVHIPPRPVFPWEMTIFDGGGLIQVRSPAGSARPGPGGIRGEVNGFSEASRRRLLRRLQMTKKDVLPVFATLTYPDDFPKDPKVWKADLEAFGKRLARVHPEAAFFWKLELKRRLTGTKAGEVAPHFHLLMWNVPWTWTDPKGRQLSWAWQVAKQDDLRDGARLLKRVEMREGEAVRSCEYSHREKREGETVRDFVTEYIDRKGRHCVKVETWILDGKNHLREESARHVGKFTEGEVCLREWLSMAWAAVVGSEDPRHLTAGTNCEQIRTREGVMFYASKYVCKVDGESVPGVGRYWGVFNAQSIPWAVPVLNSLTWRQAVRVMRAARRYVAASMRGSRRRVRWRSGAGMTFFCDASTWLRLLPRLAGDG